jgi:hypothetical protein
VYLYLEYVVFYISLVKIEKLDLKTTKHIKYQR